MPQDRGHLPYRHPIIQKAINTIWFEDQSADGILVQEYFSPMPIPAIALALTLVRTDLDLTCVCTPDAYGVPTVTR
jgi:Domain of unknown function (DUF6532)